ncbi:MAG: sodium:solute symporter family protein [Verrucomicrobiota bacterium]
MNGLSSTVLSTTMGYALLLFFGLLWIGLGIYWGKKAKNLDGYMLAGRNIGLALASATAMATWVTSNTVMVAPLFALKMGVWGMLAYCTASFGLFLFAPMAKRIRELMPSAYTSGDFMRLRFGKTAWALFLCISIVYSMSWLVSMGMAGGKFLEALSGIPFLYGMTAILLVCVLYTLFGGLYAVIGTDFIQSIIILIGIVVVGIFVLMKIDMQEVYVNLSENQPSLLKVFMPVALLAIFNNMFFGFGEVFHNNVWWSRAFAMREGVPMKAFLLSGILWLPIPVAAGFIGLCAGPLGINITDPDMAAPLIAAELLGPSLAILVFIVLFCSLASSIDSLLAATSDLVTEDIYRKLFRVNASEAKTRNASMLIIIGLGILTWVLCYGSYSYGWNLIEVLFLSGPLVASAIWPVVAGLYYPKVPRIAASVSMLLGSVVGLIVYFQIGWFVASLTGAVVSGLTVLLISLCKQESFQWNSLDEKMKGTSQ